MLKFIRKIIPDYAHLPLISCAITQVLAYIVTKYIHIADFVDISLPLDHRIPLRAGWVVIYILSYVYWAVGYVAIARVSRDKCRKLIVADIVCKVVCALFFIFMPVTIDRPEITGNGIFDMLMRLIYTLDTPENLFPSMHCLFSWLVARELMDIKEYGLWVKAAAVVVSILVFISTLFTRQHYIMDIAGGVAAAELGILVARLTERHKTSR